jgi:hypothetical protein
MLRNVNNENTVAVHITEACNLACPGCYTRFYPRAGTKNLDEQVRQLRKLNPEYITLYGGEPLCDVTGARRILKEFPEKKFILHTNATLAHDEYSDIYDKVNIIFFTIESFAYHSQPSGRFLKPSELINVLENLLLYGDKGIIIHNIYPKFNDHQFYRQARAINIPYYTYPIVAPTDFCDISEREFRKLRVLPEPLIRPKRRILVDGTVTRDMRGVYNDVDALPCHGKCLSCEVGKQCPYFTMFPHFVKDYLDNNTNHWFCEMTSKYTGVRHGR